MMKHVVITAIAEDAGVTEATGAQLAALRAVLGLSRHQVADALDISHVTLALWEQSRCSIPAERERQWRQAIEVATQARLASLARQEISLGILPPMDVNRARSVLKLE